MSKQPKTDKEKKKDASENAPVAIDPAPAVVEAPAPVEVPVEAVPPVEVLPIVGLDVFAVSGAFRPDQIAGFVRYAQIQKLEPRTIPEWRTAYTAFMNRPV